MDADSLQQQVTAAAQELGVPGVAVGVHQVGEQLHAVHGVTSVEHPLPVDAGTLFGLGSIGKTFTATAVMRLVDEGRVELHERVRTYVPELRLRDERVAEQVTVLQLLNHTAGWEGDAMPDTGEGDDAVQRYVATLAGATQHAPLGGEPSYNNAALVLAGRVVEQVTGEPYDRALRTLVLDPLGLGDTVISLNDLLTRRVAAGHTRRADGLLTVVRPWSSARAELAAGGRIAATAADQLAWARFHMGDGRAPDGTRVLSAEALAQMQRETSAGPTQRYGIVWMLRDAGGVAIVEHSGSENGHHALLSMVPERDWAISILTNAGPAGQELRTRVARWARAAFLGVTEQAPEPLALDQATLVPYAGRYATDEQAIEVAVAGSRLALAPVPPTGAAAPPPEATSEELPPPFHAGLVGDDRFVVVDGPYGGMQGHFVRGADGAIAGLHLGRLARRVVETNEER